MKKYLTKKRIILLAASLAVLALFVLIGIYSKKRTSMTSEEARSPQIVTVKSVKESRSFSGTIEYPATIAGDQEIEVAAKSAGTATAVNFSLGDYVSVGSLLVKIDDVGPKLKVGDNGFRDSDIKQDELAVEKAEEALETAKKTYDDIKDQYEEQKKNPTALQTVTKAQRDAAKGAVEIAEIDLENAKVGFKGSLDNHLIISPITGYVTRKSVETGDSISVGTQLFSISKTKKIKTQFYVDEAQLSSFQKGTEVALLDNEGKSIPAVVRNISPQADSVTKRFLIEAYPKYSQNEELLPGTLVRIKFYYTKTPSGLGEIILPLSVLSVGQNENYIFTSVDGMAKKVNVDVVSVDGETANIKVDLPDDAEIIFEGSKLLSDGEAIDIKR